MENSIGVMACDRTGCVNIMCRRCILENTKYICDSCWDELVEHRDNWPSSMTAKRVKDLILQFMDTDPGTHAIIETSKEFDRLTNTGRHGYDE